MKIWFWKKEEKETMNEKTWSGKFGKRESE